MGLVPKENQPFRFTSRNEYQNCVSDKTICQLLQDGDDVYFQFDNEPCEDQLICDPTFATAAGDLISNGEFSGSAGGWTLGATWSYDLAGFVTINNAGSQSQLEQTIGAGVENGHCYVVVFTVSNYAAGSITPQLGATSGTAVSANGTYRQLIVAGAVNEKLSFFGPMGANMSLDDIQLYDLGPCWCADNGYVSVETGSGWLCHISGQATTLSVVNTLPAIVSGRLYKVTITVANRTQGTVHCVVGTAAVTDTYSTNGSFTDYVIADANNSFDVVFNADFDGCVTEIRVWEMTTNHDFVLSNGLITTGSLTAFAQYIDDLIIVSFNMDDLSLDYGCHYIVAHDQCTGEFLESQCFNYQATHAGTRQVIAIDRISTDDNVRYSFGLTWVSTFFYLIQRVNLNFRKPNHESQFTHDRFSTGSRFKSYVEKSKIWELAIIDLDETKHDCMAIQWQCRSVSIDGTEYFTQDEEYTPNYDEKGFKTLTDVTLLVTRKQDVLFSDNCNR